MKYSLISWKTHLISWNTHLSLWNTHLALWNTHLTVWNNHLTSWNTQLTFEKLTHSIHSDSPLILLLIHLKQKRGLTGTPEYPWNTVPWGSQQRGATGQPSNLPVLPAAAHSSPVPSHCTTANPATSTRVQPATCPCYCCQCGVWWGWVFLVCSIFTYKNFPSFLCVCSNFNIFSFF